MNDAITFFVPGPVQTAGSKTVVPIRRDGEDVGHRVVESGDRKAKSIWRDDLRSAAVRAARSHQGWFDREPVDATFLIVRKRDASMLRSGRFYGDVKDWAADLRPVTRPDALKVARAAEDALTGILWADDAQIVSERIEKFFGDQLGLSPRVEGLLVSARECVFTAGMVGDRDVARAVVDAAGAGVVVPFVPVVQATPVGRGLAGSTDQTSA